MIALQLILCSLILGLVGLALATSFALCRELFRNWTALSRRSRAALGLGVLLSVLWAQAFLGIGLFRVLLEASAVRSNAAPAPNGRYYLYDYTGNERYIHVSRRAFEYFYWFEVMTYSSIGAGIFVSVAVLVVNRGYRILPTQHLQELHIVDGVTGVEPDYGGRDAVSQAAEGSQSEQRDGTDGECVTAKDSDDRIEQPYTFPGRAAAVVLLCAFSAGLSLICAVIWDSDLLRATAVVFSVPVFASMFAIFLLIIFSAGKSAFVACRGNRTE